MRVIVIDVENLSTISQHWRQVSFSVISRPVYSFVHKVDISKFLIMMMEKGASDMFITSGAPIQLKVEGTMYPLGDQPLPPEATQMIAEKLMSSQQKAAFERDLELNFAVAVGNSGRFRINVFKQRGEIALVIRAIKTTIPTMAELSLPPILRDIIMSKRGLVLVVGATGSGKSTTLASMIDHRNSSIPGHILTIEDPIEYLHQHKRGLVNQREVGMDTHDFREALKNAMREAPDVILIGEILDQTTMEAAISMAETGHLCLGTLHSNNSDQTIERILNFFPEGAHKNILMNLSLNLRAIISQRLVVGMDGRRIPACEILLNTPMIADLLRRGQAHEIKQAMEDSLDPGIVTFDNCLFKMVKSGQITMEEALANADSRDGLELKFRLSDGSDTAHDPYADVHDGQTFQGAFVSKPNVTKSEDSSSSSGPSGYTPAEDPYNV